MQRDSKTFKNVGLSLTIVCNVYATQHFHVYGMFAHFYTPFHVALYSYQEQLVENWVRHRNCLASSKWRLSDIVLLWDSFHASAQIFSSLFQVILLIGVLERKWQTYPAYIFVRHNLSITSCIFYCPFNYLSLKTEIPSSGLSLPPSHFGRIEKIWNLSGFNAYTTPPWGRWDRGRIERNGEREAGYGWGILQPF